MRFNRQRNKLVGKLLVTGSNRLHLWWALSVLFVGLFLFMISVLVCCDFHLVLNNNNDNSGSSFITISKRIDKDPIRQKPLVFTGRETEELRYAPQVQGVAELIPNSFCLKLKLGDSVLTTPLTIESVNPNFIDNPPVDWYWETTSPSVPVIIPRDLQSLYNYNFAASRGLFALTDAMVKNLALKFVVGDSVAQKMYNVTIVGFSDRIASILVPDSFIIINERIFGRQSMAPSRLLVKVKNPSDGSFINYLQRNSYATNKELLHWNKARIISGWANKVLLVMTGLMFGACILAFLLFVNMTIFKALGSLNLLLQLGYDTAYLIRYIFTRYIGLLLLVSLPVVILILFIQARLAGIAKMKHVLLPEYPGWYVWLALTAGMFVLSLLLIAVVMKLVNYATQNKARA